MYRISRNMTAKILIVYYSLHGSTKMLANEIALGVESTGCESVIRTVPKVHSELTTGANLTHADLPMATKGPLAVLEILQLLSNFFLTQHLIFGSVENYQGSHLDSLLQLQRFMGDKKLHYFPWHSL